VIKKCQYDDDNDK